MLSIRNVLGQGNKDTHAKIWTWFSSLILLEPVEVDHLTIMLNSYRFVKKIFPLQ